MVWYGLGLDLLGTGVCFTLTVFFRFWLRVLDKLTTLSFLVPVRLSSRIVCLCAFIITIARVKQRSVYGFASEFFMS